MGDRVLDGSSGIRGNVTGWPIRGLGGGVEAGKSEIGGRLVGSPPTLVSLFVDGVDDGNGRDGAVLGIRLGSSEMPRVGCKLGLADGEVLPDGLRSKMLVVTLRLIGAGA